VEFYLRERDGNGGEIQFLVSDFGFGFWFPSQK
jgi:hypothetical protein